MNGELRSRVSGDSGTGRGRASQSGPSLGLPQRPRHGASSSRRGQGTELTLHAGAGGPGLRGAPAGGGDAGPGHVPETSPAHSLWRREGSSWRAGARGRRRAAEPCPRGKTRGRRPRPGLSLGPECGRLRVAGLTEDLNKPRRHRTSPETDRAGEVMLIKASIWVLILAAIYLLNMHISSSKFPSRGQG